MESEVPEVKAEPLSSQSREFDFACVCDAAEFRGSKPSDAVLFKVSRHSEDFIRKYAKRKSTKTCSEFCGLRKFIRKVRLKSQLLVVSTVKL